MSDVVIRVENLCKEYRLGTISHGTLYRDIQSGWAKLRGTEDPNARIGAVNREQLNNTNDRFSALKDVSFDVRQGEIVGIIGRNGAGKSTLLKIISRVTAPTSGTIKIKGRVASLLEVGTGFHPELTGRENIFLNGAILGMHKGEIEQKFDDIVKFAEIDKFIDTPVKRYSSGMYVRLAFAVAAHLEPEILVVDEVLAVGDAEFQKKCLGKMKEISEVGRTVLFVSHNLGAIQRLCSRCVVLEQGIVSFDSNVNDSVNFYLKNKTLAHQKSWEDISKAPGNDVVRLRSIRFCDQAGNGRHSFDVRDSVILEIIFEVFIPRQLAIAVEFIGRMDTNIMVSTDNYTMGSWGNQLPYSVGIYKSLCRIPGDFLNEGLLSVNLRIYSPPTPPNVASHVHLIDAVTVTIEDKHHPEGVRGSYPYEWGSPVIRPRLHWTTVKQESLDETRLS